MKKVLAMIFVLVMVCSVTGCKGKNDNVNNDNNTTTQAPITTPEATATPVPDTEPKTADASAQPEAQPTDVPVPTVDYDAVLTAYGVFLTNDYMSNHYDESYEEIKYSLGFINEDDIPELFITEGFYHACGTQVFTYIDGKIVPVGEFGEYGGFAFTPGMNNIYSYYYGMGTGINCIYSMNSDGTLEQKTSLMTEEVWDDETGDATECRYYIGDEQVSEEAYEAEYSKYEYEDIPNWYYDYFENFASVADTVYTYREVLKYMLDKALSGEIFKGYITPEIEAMVGEWEIVKADIHDVENQVFDLYEAGEVNSVITVSSDYSADYWLSAWVKDDGSNIFQCEYNMKMTYLPIAVYDGVENDEYSIRCKGEWSDQEYYLVMINDADGVETLELAEFYGDSSNIIAYYHRVDSAEPVGTRYFGELKAYPELTRNDGTECYIFREYMWITGETDDEIKAQYGLAPDLDGYDYEIVKLDKEPMIVYGSQFGPSAGWTHYTCYKIMDYDSMNHKTVSYEEFLNAVSSTYDGMFVDLYIEDGTDIANYISEAYTG